MGAVGLQHSRIILTDHQQRIYVHESVYDPFVSKFVDIAKASSAVVRLPIADLNPMFLRLTSSEILQSQRQIWDL